MADEKKKVLDPHAFYLGKGGIHGRVPEGGVPFTLMPIEDLASELGAELVPGASAASINQQPRQPGPMKVSGIEDSRNVASLGVATTPKSHRDEDEEDDEDEDDPEAKYAGWTKPQLRAEADKRGLEVERGDGEEGAPLVADYVRALVEDDQGGDDEDEDEDEDEE